MLENLDMRTLLTVGAMVCLTLAAVMVYYSFTRKTYPGFHSWTLGAVSVGVGAVLIAMRGLLPDITTIVVGNTLVGAMPLFFINGMNIFNKAKWKHKKIDLTILATFTAILTTATYIYPSLYIRISCLSLILIFFFSKFLYILIKDTPPLLL